MEWYWWLLIVLASFYLIHFMVTVIVFTIEFIKERNALKVKDFIIMCLLLIPMTLFASWIYVGIWNDKVDQKNYWKDKYLKLENKS